MLRYKSVLRLLGSENLTIDKGEQKLLATSEKSVYAECLRKENKWNVARAMQ